MLEYISEAGKSLMSVGKISDIYNGKGVTESVKIKNNNDGVDKTLEFMKTDKEGFTDMGKTILDLLKVETELVGESFASALE